MKKAILIFVLIVLLAACGSQKVVNNLKLVQTVGFDMSEKGVRTVAIIADYEEGKSNLEYYLTESNSVFDSLPRLRTKLDFPNEYGQLRMALFGEAFARKGIRSVTDTMIRHPVISSRMQIGVADREALDILRVMKNKKDPYFLFDMIENNIKNGNLPLMNLHITLFNFYGEGRDVFLPYFTVEDEEIKIDGLGLFKGDQFKTHINIREAFLLKLLLGSSRNGSLMIPVKGAKPQSGDYFLMNSIRAKSNLKVTNLGPPASVSIQLKLRVTVKDAPEWMDLSSETQLDSLEQTIETYLEEEISRFVSQCQKNQVDPVGFGDLIRSKSQHWDARQFASQYEDLQTTVDVKGTISHTGASQ
ncbi:Ger(x)C family spore germination protein [Paenibacillus koleovorans]|uniref:Ger(x)C family spore germination protein n=1 Tax=Paenibacillus koleovorans TaxID=121608 RepID=UPI000FD88DB9|nr:Ger(x)C family spore germination protein [Paenibacillus koleovorans]